MKYTQEDLAGYCVRLRTERDSSASFTNARFNEQSIKVNTRGMEIPTGKQIYARFPGRSKEDKLYAKVVNTDGGNPMPEMIRPENIWYLANLNHAAPLRDWAKRPPTEGYITHIFGGGDASRVLYLPKDTGVINLTQDGIELDRKALTAGHIEELITSEASVPRIIVSEERRRLKQARRMIEEMGLHCIYIAPERANRT